MVLSNDWKKLLKSIGGVQYLSDLKGKRKAFYENLRTESLILMEKRNKLRKEIDEALKTQHRIAVDNAVDEGMKARSLPWDNPTEVEIEAEVEENKECCR